ncbi:hypothetical protein Pelo_2735 [Pelomyxa schiedti]|nr:hypothetical protein Pelo_2735 [Pelomyxa schiedti]
MTVRTWARDQFVALALSHHPRCGCSSPARVLPQPVLVDEIGRELVMSVERTVSIGMRVLSDLATPWLCVSLSVTLGVVWLREFRCLIKGESSSEFLACFDDCVMELRREERGDAVVVRTEWNSGLQHIEWTGICISRELRRNDKWMFLGITAGTEFVTLLWPVGVNIRGSCHNIASPKGISLRWIAMLEGDEALVSTLPQNGGPKRKEELWCVNLREAYQTSLFLPNATMPGYTTNRKRQIEIVLKSRKHGLIAAVCDQRTEYRSKNPNFCELRSIRPNSNVRRLLQGDKPTLLKIDASHFLERGTEGGHETIKLFSTDDLATPIRRFRCRQDTQVRCSNGFIAFQTHSRVDLYDALSGTWMLRHPFPSDRCVRMSLDTLLFNATDPHQPQDMDSTP